VLDEADVLHRVQGDRDLLAQIAAMFLDNYPGQLAAVRQALAEQDAARLNRAAHAFKGAAANFSARAAVAAAQRLENDAAAGNLSAAREALAALEAAIPPLVTAIQALAVPAAAP